jgi:hypothetical protein
MTRETCKDLLPLFVAFAKGDKIEYSNHHGEWKESDSIGFGATGYHRYKINGNVYSVNSELSNQIIQFVTNQNK